MQSSKPSYSASEVGALPSSTKIPSKTSDLTNDSGFLTQHQSLANYEKKMGIAGTPTLVNNTLTIPVNQLGSYYRLGVSAPTTITLPDMANETVMTITGVIVNITLSTGGSLTLSATQPIYENGLDDIEEGATFEINAIYNGAYWAVTVTKLELYNPS
jgi:NADH:ubiquinone oxidoreductase subunit F (NADH-binding)